MNRIYDHILINSNDDNSPKEFHLVLAYNKNEKTLLDEKSLEVKKNQFNQGEINERFSGKGSSSTKFTDINTDWIIKKNLNSFLYNFLKKTKDANLVFKLEANKALLINESFIKAANCSCFQNVTNNGLLINNINDLIRSNNKGSNYLKLELALNFYKLLMKDYKTNHMVCDYSKKLKVKPKQLLKNMKGLGFKNPSVLIKEKLLFEAMRLLVNSNKSIRNICFELGFDDPSYFARIFKKNTGITARKYRMDYLNSKVCEKCPV